MVVGLHTVTAETPGQSNKDQVNTVLGVTFFGMPFLPMATGYALGAPLLAAGNRRKKTLPTADDKIVAVEYRQIKLRQISNATNRTEKGNDSVSIEGEIMDTVNNEDVLEVFGMATDDGKDSLIVTPLEG